SGVQRCPNHCGRPHPRNRRCRLSLYSREGRREMSDSMLAVTGMTCADCARHVEAALRGVFGVRQVRVDYPHGIARIDSESPLTIDTLNAALPKGYRVKSLPAGEARSQATPPGSVLARA